MQTDQLTLSPADREALYQLAQRTGKAETELLHEAVTILIQQTSSVNRLMGLRQARGMWEQRTDLPDFNRIRAEGWDRSIASNRG